MLYISKSRPLGPVGMLSSLVPDEKALILGIMYNIPLNLFDWVYKYYGKLLERI